MPLIIALFFIILKNDSHEVSMFDSTDYPNPKGDYFDSDKQKEIYPNSRPFNDNKLVLSFKEENVCKASRNSLKNNSPDLIAFIIPELVFLFYAI